MFGTLVLCILNTYSIKNITITFFMKMFRYSVSIYWGKYSLYFAYISYRILNELNNYIEN